MIPLKWRLKNFLATTKHKAWVFWYTLRACAALLRRSWHHDLSKYGQIEEPHFSQASFKLSQLEYGSAEYKASLDQLKPALDHHYLNNRHHPEFYGGKIEDMSPLDLLEMLVDWKAAGRRHKTGSMRNSLKVNGERFKISIGQQDALRRDAEEMRLLNPGDK